MAKVIRWAVRPDPETGVCHRQEIVEALMDGESMLYRAGGVLTVVQDRGRTDLEGERLPIGVVFEWKDRTDAKLARDAPAAADPEPEELEAALEAEASAEEAFLKEAAVGEDESSMEPAAR